MEVSRRLSTPVSTGRFARCWLGISVLLLLGASVLVSSESALEQQLGRASFSLALGALAFAFAGRVGSIPLVALGLQSSRLTPTARLTAIGAGLALITLAAAVLPADAARMATPGLEPGGLRWIGSLLSLVLLPAFFEELFFRGALRVVMTDRWGPTGAILATSILFALLHAGPHGMLFALAMGLCLGIIAHRSGAIWETIAIHAINNAILFVSWIV